MNKPRQHPPTHIEHAGQPFCGVHVDPLAIFIPCLPGVEIELVTCGNCRTKYKAHLQEIVDNMMTKFLSHKPHKIVDEPDTAEIKVA